MSAAWTGVIATLLGVALGGALSWLLEKARWRHEDRTRWHRDRRDVYVRMLEAADDYRDATNRHAAAAFGEPPDEERFLQAFEDLRKASMELRRLIFETKLLAGKDVQIANGRLQSALIETWTVQLKLGEQPPMEEEETAAREEVTAAIAAFEMAARREIGLEEIPDLRPSPAAR